MSDIRKWKKLIESMDLKEDPVADADYTDHEVSMAKSQMLSSMKSINRIAKHLSTKSESEGLEGWTASKLTMAEDYLQVVADYFDGQEINEGYKVLPPMDKEKYQARDGLEGPFSTLSGKVVYYDPKEGKYYDPDTDMYMSYDEFRRYDDDYKGMKDERDEVNEAHQIDWPYEDMEDHAYNAIRHGMHAYDAFDHVFSMAKDEYQRDWLNDNKDDIIKMFASYGLQTEGLEEGQISEARWEFKPNKTYMVGDRLTWDDKYEFYLSQEDADILNKFMQQAENDDIRKKVWRVFWSSEETGDTAQGPAKAIAYAKKKLGISEAKQRLDPKCWDGYKKQGTKMKGGKRVNNCVPK